VKRGCVLLPYRQVDVARDRRERLKRGDIDTDEADIVEPN
jgi:hypothetical protein